MIETALDVVPPVIEADNNRISEFRDGLEANGGGFYQIDDEQLVLWNKRLETVREGWIENLSAQGKPAREILDRWTELVTE